MAPLRSTLGRSLGRLIRLGRTKDLAGEGTGGAALEGQLNSKYYGARDQVTENELKLGVTGGTLLAPGNGYRYHIFTGPGNLVVEHLSTSPSPTANQVDYFIVGGGGSGGGEYSGPNQVTGGGGGAGGVLTATGIPVSATSYPVVIGDGGAQPNPQGRNAGAPGGVTTVFGKTAYGGGAGGTYPSTGSLSGGSGGGSGRRNTGTYKYGLNPTTPGPVINNFPAYEPGTTQGYPGGVAGGTSNDGGGGGGGASAAGAAGSNGNGGDGITAFSGDTGIPPSYGTPGPTTGRWFAGGGAAGLNGGGDGGAGGGAPGPRPVPAGGAYGTAATANTGGGGSGGRSGAPGNLPDGGSTKGGAGGSGICIIRYPY